MHACIHFFSSREAHLHTIVFLSVSVSVSIIYYTVIGEVRRKSHSHTLILSAPNGQ